MICLGHALLTYCKVGNIRGGFIFAIFAICWWNANSTPRELLINYYPYCQRYLTVHINCLTVNLRPRELVKFWNPRKFDPAKIKLFWHIVWINDTRFLFRFISIIEFTVWVTTKKQYQYFHTHIIQLFIRRSLPRYIW